MSTVSNWAMMISITVICLSFGLIVTNDINQEFQLETGRPLIHGIVGAEYLNYSDMPVISTASRKFNATTNDLLDYAKPNDVDFDFDFWQSIKYTGILVELLIYSVYGFPEFLYTNFNLPLSFTIAIWSLITLAHILFIMKLIRLMERIIVKC